MLSWNDFLPIKQAIASIVVESCLPIYLPAPVLSQAHTYDSTMIPHLEPKHKKTIPILPGRPLPILPYPAQRPVLLEAGACDAPYSLLPKYNAQRPVLLEAGA